MGTACRSIRPKRPPVRVPVGSARAGPPIPGGCPGPSCSVAFSTRTPSAVRGVETASGYGRWCSTARRPARSSAISRAGATLPDGVQRDRSWRPAGGLDPCARRLPSGRRCGRSEQDSKAAHQGRHRDGDATHPGQQRAAGLLSPRGVDASYPPRWNFIKSGLIGPKGYLIPTFPFIQIEGPTVPIENSITGQVPADSLRWPPSVEVWKGFLGQRVIAPPPNDLGPVP
jgi:hypothetical protein